ncbi:hypothetical protein COV04_03595 [Candidatus Uhrbacteria bacterium CG10_big_fil_rev_8_21_14_0_10_48_11]|uniref:Uncharacterized protein n=1 Tax=Candidatus Uhrbacteria bacterium CG10_big_fil_rev_8_21_14_0_10_48_11 TaxID=1975037 RepID=A0A2M8LE61_9BACT|nr:MAG: hypothetical protein COV04_03595 [Candidatus Uhrbacteria bacterium CG10_big_fil_rev_8_21_14_0_10_48_11]
MYTSHDILNFILAFCTLWLTVFIAWMLYYVVMLLRDAHRTFTELRERLAVIDRFISLVSEKAEHASTSLQLLVEGVTRVATFFIGRKAERPRSSAKRKRNSAT